MLRFVKKLFCVLLTGSAMFSVGAFSLLGPFDTWQAANVGYNLNFDSPVVGSNGDVGGPMNLGEEYRWNSPVLSYGFDPSFVEFFRQEGIDAIESAIKIFNDLPAASAMSADLSEFPLDTRRYNYRAGALQIRDLKSWTMSVLLESLGLAAPERYIYTLRSRVVVNTIPVYSTVKRNFDPVSLLPTSYVNGTLYTFNIFQSHFAPPIDAWEAVELTVDPLAPSVTSVAAYAGLLSGTSDSRAGAVLFNPGIFYTGLTRDDVGAIRYLLRTSNYNVEALPANFTSGQGAGGTGSGTTDGGLPWLPAGGISGGAGGAGGVAAGGVGGVGAVGGATTTVVDAALRPGVDKLKFFRVDYDSGLSQFFTNNVVYSDRFITNGAPREQLVQIIQTQPDILFSAADLGLGNNNAPILFSRTLTFQNNSTLNTGAGGAGLAGPGTITAPVQIIFSKVGPFTQHFGDGPEYLGQPGLVWGSFDASTNAPVIFPTELGEQGIRELERIVLQGSGGTQWRPAQP